MENVLDFIFSSSSSDSENDSSKNEFNRKRPKIKNFVTEVVDKYTDEEFKENFRMRRNTFEYILSLVKEDISSSLVDVGHPTLDAKHQLLLTIWYFATPDSYRSICGRFNIGKATGQRTVRRVTKALIKLSSSIIHWPNSNDINVIKNEFLRKGFLDTIGCIDGSYIPIPQPKDHGVAYICRKNFSCIILQAVCDHRMLFTHCYAGEVGSVHDATVLKRSEVWEYLSRNEMFPENTHLLGDKAYPLLPTLMTPYKDNGHLSNNQKKFNYIHSKCRSVIERTFALLKNRFRILKYMDIRNLVWGIKYIIACCILHNACILREDLFEIEFENQPDEDAEIMEISNNETDRQRHVIALEKRNQICVQLSL